ncbi:MAG: diguanylate cyclase, partial [Pleurocapsa sp. MO_226.B13]|nr:diguanylate cyclase [Pleurocapsa sp. MO_226.B13]
MELAVINSFMPHGMCYLWKTWLVSLHLVSNGIIALSYFSIPLILVYILRQREDIPFNGIFLLFAAFILFCGAGHAFDIWTLWNPNYWISGWLKLLTALISLATAIALAMKIPEILTLPSPTQIKKINQQLQEKIAELEQQKSIIRQQEQFLRTIYDNVREAIFVVDVESEGIFRYQGFNPAAKRL